MAESNLVEMFRRRTRHPLRPRTSDVIARIFSNFRAYPETGGSLVVGESEFQERRLVVIGQEKPKPANLKTKEDLEKLNWGMLTAEEHSKVMTVLKRAVAKEPERTMVLTFIDTYGADISMESAERFQAFWIAHLIREFLVLPVPTISIVLGEGGSGGALALQYTDRRAQMDDAIYATAPPESMAAIVFRDPSRIEDALQLLKPTGKELKQRRVIHSVLQSPENVKDVAGFAAAIEPFLIKTVRDLSKTKIKKLLALRRKRAETFGFPRHSKLSGFLESLDTPFTSRFLKAPPDIQLVDQSSLNEITDDYASGQIIDPKADYIRCGESKKKGGGRGCGRLIELEEFVKNHHVCPFCGQAETLGAAGWIECLADHGSFHEMDSNLSVEDILDARDIPQTYHDFLYRQKDRTPFNESLVTGHAKVYDHPVALAVSEFNFSGGSMGVAFGEKLKRAVDYCLDVKTPLISVCCSGGARLYEGISALMQMVKSIAAVQRLKDEGLLFISILGDPSTGGAVASYAALGDVIIAEPSAMVIFAGPRVMRSRGFPVDEKRIRADSLKRISCATYDNREFFHGVRGIHEVAARTEIKRVCARYLDVFEACHK